MYTPMGNTDLKVSKLLSEAELKETLQYSSGCMEKHLHSRREVMMDQPCNRRGKNS